MDELLKEALDALEDAKCELDQPEIAELTTLALDRKLETVITKIKQELDLD